MSDELDVAAKYGLFWASTTWEREDGHLLADSSYIYQPERFSKTFSVLFDKLRQLNDYCYQLLLSVEERWTDLNQQRASAIACSDTGAEELCWLDDVIPHWDDNVKVVTHATSAVLLSSFLEWGLKRIAKDLNVDIPRKSGRGMSDVKFLLLQLKQSGLNIQLDPKIDKAIDNLRSVRNSYAHGEWDQVEKKLTKISLIECFKVVSELFVHLEKAVWDGPWKGETQSGS